MYCVGYNTSRNELAWMAMSASQKEGIIRAPIGWVSYQIPNFPGLYMCLRLFQRSIVEA